MKRAIDSSSRTGTAPSDKMALQDALHDVRDLPHEGVDSPVAVPAERRSIGDSAIASKADDEDLLPASPLQTDGAVGLRNDSLGGSHSRREMLHEERRLRNRFSSNRLAVVAVPSALRALRGDVGELSKHVQHGPVGNRSATMVIDLAKRRSHPIIGLANAEGDR